MIQAVDKPAEARLTKVNLALPDGTSGSYYIYPEEQTRFERVLVYVHGLISDQNWFRIPKNLPDDTGILFLLRQPRTHAEHFATWTDNYEACMEHYRETHHASWYHLIAQCYGTQIGLHWSMTRPESFDSQTLVSPPVVMRQEFSVREKFGILFGAKKQFRRSLLHPSTYGRLPSLIRFIKENPTTTFTFSNSFFMQTGLLRRWLKKYLFTFSVPTHCIYFSDDEVQEPVGLPLRYDHIELPDRRTYMFSYHYAELLPNRDKFWDAVFTFQLEQEREFKFEGTVDTVLVTGATGFLGAHIVRGLHADGKKVIVFARNLDKAKGMFRDLGERVEYREGSLSDIDSIEQALVGVDAVVHSAGFVSEWENYEAFHRVNVQGTKHLLVIAHEQGIKQFVQISSLGVFGDTDQENISENAMYQLSSDHYSNTKILSEIFVKRYCRGNDLPYTVIRPGFIYGEGDNNFFPNLIANLKAKKAKYIGSTENHLNTVYVGNVAALVCKVIGNKECFGECYNIADPQKTKIGEFFDTVCGALDLPRPAKVLPRSVVLPLAGLVEFVYRTLRLKGVPPITRKKVTFVARSRSVNASKAYRLLGQEPYSAKEGMDRTLENLKNAQ